MARFRATLRGTRGDVSRLGHEKTGMTASVNGWDSGVTVQANVDLDGHDHFQIYFTGGSHHRVPDQLVGLVEIVNGEPVFTAKG
jgi:hypothetical protein